LRCAILPAGVGHEVVAVFLLSGDCGGHWKRATST
jgi:hypothetical protein